MAPGDRVALVAENRPEWTIADMAIMAIGAITVPAFATNTVADHRHVLSHSGAKGVIVSTKAIAERVLPAALEAHDLAFVVTMEELPIAQRIAKRLVNWRDLLEAGAGRPDDLGRNRRAPAAQRYLLLHLHLGHRRHAQGRDADPRLHPLQLPGRLASVEGHRHRQRCLPLLPAALPCL